MNEVFIDMALKIEVPTTHHFTVFRLGSTAIQLFGKPIGLLI
jgi:hypothetical protein